MAATVQIKNRDKNINTPVSYEPDQLISVVAGPPYQLNFYV